MGPSYLIATGLLVTLAGFVWQKLQVTALQHELASEMASCGHSGPASGRKVAERLERLEIEHAATISELAATKNQLDNKHQELAAINAPRKNPEAAAMAAAQISKAKEAPAQGAKPHYDPE
jgi:hypothetical protein